MFNGHLENRHDTNVVILYNVENKHVYEDTEEPKKAR